ncbi:hypothetical protein [Streptomyces sp. NBC_00343]|uniref:hypothetical protein n=1 Tax=Streptomyces sp. NBC_00343 TaxID=2975719 RepID=UPI002E295945|nr:hypothetical protein [Streptomyces sp. NBC_00343]
MGTAHHGDSNGGADHLKLNTLISYGTSGAANDTDEDTVKDDGLTAGLSDVPTAATAGGPGVTFRATVSNPTASAYENVTGVLFTSRYATVQVLRSGTWTTLKPITAPAEPDVYGFAVTGKDSTLAAHRDRRPSPAPRSAEPRRRAAGTRTTRSAPKPLSVRANGTWTWSSSATA